MAFNAVLNIYTDGVAQEHIDKYAYYTQIINAELHSPTKKHWQDIRHEFFVRYIYKGLSLQNNS